MPQGNGENCPGGDHQRKCWFWPFSGKRAAEACPRCLTKGEHILTLSDIPAGSTVRVRGHAGGERLASRLAEMGLFKGADLEVLSGGSRGPMIVRSGGCRLALGRGMTMKILVAGQEGEYRAAGD